MYFKRPSFRRGGNIGGGIMSGTNMGSRTGFQNPVINFLNRNILGRNTQIGTAPLSNVSQSVGIEELLKGTDTRGSVNTTPQTVEELYKKRGEKLKRSGDYIGSLVDNTYKDREGNTRDRVTGEIITDTKTSSGIAEMLNSGDPAQFTGEDELTDFEAIKQAEIEANKATKKANIIEPGSDDSSITLDPYAEIKKEKDFLSEMLKNEGLERGEIALIAAKAIGTEGSFKDKLDAAVDLALPVVRRRNKEDKALTLTAYKSFKEKEKAKAKTTADANKPTNEMRNLENRANILIKNGDKRDKETIKAEFISNALDESPDIKSQRLIIKQYLPEIDERHGNVVTYRAELEKYKSDYKGKDITKDKKYMRLIQKVSEAESLFGTFIDDKGILLDMIPQYREVIESLSKIKFKDGGRIGYAMGTNPNETSEDIESTEVITTGGTETQEKPVLNLTYAELRDRLPPEITDQVVSLLASSEQALQDFAYITSQEDVQNFNVKYGVNLVIPPAQQTA